MPPATSQSPPTIDPVAARRWALQPRHVSAWLHEEVARRMAERLDVIRLPVRAWADWEPVRGGLAGHQLVAALRLETGVDAFYDWQGGRVWLRMEADPEAETIRRYIKLLGGGHARLVRASAAMRAVTPAFEPEPPAVAALSARLREKFDPKGIFNPGLMG